MLEFINTNGHRVQEACIYTLLDSFGPFLESFTKASPTLLEVVNFGSIERRVEDKEQDAIILSLFTKLFSNAPFLRRLTLVETPMIWNWPALTRLTHLHVHFVQQPGLLHALRHISNLVELELRDSVPEHPQFQPWTILSSATVNLPELRCLRLGDTSLHKCSYFIKHLRFSPTTDIILDIPLHTDSVYEELNSQPIPPIFLPNDRLSVILKDRAVSFIEPYVGLALSTTPDRPESETTLRFFLAALQAFSHERGPKRLNLRMDTVCSVSCEIWSKLLEAMVELESLEISGGVFPGSWWAVCDALSNKLLVSDEGEIRLPRLKFLGVKFDGLADDARSHFEFIRRILHSRIKLGIRISHLSVWGDSGVLSHEEEEALRDLVDTMEWRKLPGSAD